LFQGPWPVHPVSAGSEGKAGPWMLKQAQHDEVRDGSPLGNGAYSD